MPISDPRTIVPIRWPAAWKSEAQLALLAGTPVNCVIDATAAVATAARAKGLTAITKDEAASSVAFVPDAVWPSVKMARRGEGADSGPTGAPWVDANGWSIQLARAQSGGKPVWVDAVPPADRVLDDNSFSLAVAEPAVFGARWVIALDEAGAAKLAAGDAAAKQRWTRMMNVARFFERHRTWADQPTRSHLAVVSDFADPNEFMAKEFLNLAARRNTPYRICPRHTAARADLSGIQAVLYVDEQPPANDLARVLEAFVRGGGLLIARKQEPFTKWTGDSAQPPIPGYESRAVGKGKVLVPSTPWEDPWLLAQETRILIGRRTDVIRLYNTGVVTAHYTRSKDGSGTVHLLNYSSFGRRGGGAVQQAAIAPADRYETASAVAADFAEPKPLKIERRPNAFAEIALPAFGVHMAVELGR